MQGVDATEPLGPAKRFAGTVSSPGNGWSLRAAARGRREEPSYALAGMFSSEEISTKRGSRSRSQGLFLGRGGRATSSRGGGCREAHSSDASRHGEASKLSRGSGWHAPSQGVPHGRARRRLAALRRPGDVRRSGASALLREGSEAPVSSRLGGRLSDRPTVMHQGHRLHRGNLGQRVFGRIGSRHRATKHHRDVESVWVGLLRESEGVEWGASNRLECWDGVKARARAVCFGRARETGRGVLVDGGEEMPRTARMIGCMDAS